MDARPPELGFSHNPDHRQRSLLASGPGEDRETATPGAGEVVTTPPRQLVPDLDTLPFPAYDLLPVERLVDTYASLRECKK